MSATAIVGVVGLTVLFLSPFVALIIAEILKDPRFWRMLVTDIEMVRRDPLTIRVEWLNRFASIYWRSSLTAYWRSVEHGGRARFAIDQMLDDQVLRLDMMTAVAKRERQVG